MAREAPDAVARQGASLRVHGRRTRRLNKSLGERLKLPKACHSHAERTVSSLFATIMEPVGGIERSVCRLQFGCFATKLHRHQLQQVTDSIVNYASTSLEKKGSSRSAFSDLIRLCTTSGVSDGTVAITKPGQEQAFSGR